MHSSRNLHRTYESEEESEEWIQVKGPGSEEYEYTTCSSMREIGMYTLGFGCDNRRLAPGKNAI